MPDFQLDDIDGQALARLQSAIQTPMQPYYRTVHEKAACLFRSLVKNHALKDGNKRLGVVALDVFLRINGVDSKVTQKDVVYAALAIARHEGNYPLDIITRWIRSNCAGRPRGSVTALAGQWERMSRTTMFRVRRQDIRAGRPARIPGRRVRATRPLRESLGPVKGLPGGKVVLRGGPRDGELVDLPFLAEPGTIATGVHPDDIGLDQTEQRRVEYEVVDEKQRRRLVAEYRGIEPAESVDGGGAN
jgi:death-on-curing protein